ncbi:Transducin/WD40 repeat-like superfamily protein putative isoform 1 [Tripterygium wilfordii]|uniref:RING-type E3 ubiquitin transferase n=1 Tax=Tripterygium wilfordii TaxID=458696 RepID=A0A7J7CTW2_TRIWF|nr:E3 ubiquitin-protein ligase RFWD3 [Tripterygium wilfordii]XP_038718785.1 E3 ubiquitin-protein ligase RFWD3 [Tripterygium wilfordii]KAF5737520.1 Transducin/WD40 repeat-like superfamily protein putative isoform 1 [Tripterygium wilfordii]
MPRRNGNGFAHIDEYFYDENMEIALEQYLAEQEPSSSGSESESEEEEGEEEEDEEEEEVVEYVPVENSARVLHPDHPVSNLSEESREKRRRLDGGGDTCLSNRAEGGECSSQEWNRTEIEGLFCPICMEAWTSEGDHHICCLPCGHLYGLSCIKKWLQQSRISRKCPQCNRKCTLNDVRKLYAPRIAVVDEESQKRIKFLEAKCASLEKKGADWLKKEAEWQKKEAELQLKVNQLRERATSLEHFSRDAQSRQSGLVAANGGCQGPYVSGGSKFGQQGYSSRFLLQRELRVDGARLVDIDPLRQILLIARRQTGVGGTYVLTKMSLIPPHESEDIVLPSCTKTIKDLRLSPSRNGLALYASLGKKLSVLSLESNNVALAYDLPAAAWSCSWDLNSSHYMYAGLQNGMLLVFDMRQTARPVESRSGLSSNPIHTIHSLMNNSEEACSDGIRTVLSASSVGVCQWDFDGVDDRPFLVPDLNSQGICISLACSPSSSDIVASYRPRIELSDEMTVSQPLLTPLTSGQGIPGSHVHLKRAGRNCYHKLGIACANVNNIRLPKSTIIGMEKTNSLLASEDDVTGELILQELPSFTVFQRFKLPKHPIHDVKYTQVLNQGLLGCISEDTLQLFRY